MRKNFLLIVIMTGVFLTACNGNNANKLLSSEEMNKTAVLIDTLIQNAITDTSGSILERSFDNAANTALLIFNGEIIEMKGDTVASGIQYSNAHYEYREWQGEITLKKDGEVVFSYKK
jgi:hypothetical protein